MKKEILLTELQYQASKTEVSSITPGDVFDNMSLVLSYLSDYTDSTLKALNVSKLKEGETISSTFDISSFNISRDDIKSILTSMQSAGEVTSMKAVFNEEITDDASGSYATLVSSCENNGWEIVGLVINEPPANFTLDSSKLDEGVLS